MSDYAGKICSRFTHNYDSETGVDGGQMGWGSSCRVVELPCLYSFALRREHSGWDFNQGSTMKNSMAFPQKVKEYPVIPYLGIYPKELRAETQSYICTPVFIAPLLEIAEKWKQPKCPLPDGWGNETQCISIRWDVIQP